MNAQTMQSLIAALVEGDQVQALAKTRQLLEIGVAPERIVNDGLAEAMRRLDDKCTVEAFNLLEVMLVGRAVSTVVSELYPEGEVPADGGKDTFVIAALQGDIHDLGKRIVKMVLSSKGYRVIDCGKDCPVETLVATAVREQARAVLVSGLITSVVPQVRKIRPALSERGRADIKVVAGGAALKQGTAEELNVDYVAETAFDGARYLERIAKEAR